MTGRNANLVNHVLDHRDIHLFKKSGSGSVTYMGQMIYLDHEVLNEDFKGIPRKTIVFRLVPFESVGLPFMNQEKDTAANLDLLKKRADGSASNDAFTRLALIKIFERSKEVHDIAIARAGGRCEYCQRDAPFLDLKDKPFLEVHHILRLSDGGPDDPQYVAALCPNCHRQAHYGRDSKFINESLLTLRGGDVPG